MPLAASLVSMLDEHGYCVGCQVVPNDTHEYVEDMLTGYYTRAKYLPDVLSTDHVGKDSNMFKRVFEKVKAVRSTTPHLFSNDKPDHTVVVTLDVYHGRQRVVAVVPKAHPNAAAGKGGNTCFNNFTGCTHGALLPM